MSGQNLHKDVLFLSEAAIRSRQAVVQAYMQDFDCSKVEAEALASLCQEAKKRFYARVAKLGEAPR